jgi:hypothetical protein
VKKMRRKAMHLTSRDRFATVFVAAIALVYVLWLAGVESQGATEVRVVTGIVLALGFGASASAVVPGFDGLLHASKLYLAGTSLLGLGAFVAGIAALVTGREVMLGVLVATTVVLWTISTVRHSIDAGSKQRDADVHPTRRAREPGFWDVRTTS